MKGLGQYKYEIIILCFHLRKLEKFIFVLTNARTHGLSAKMLQNILDGVDVSMATTIPKTINTIQ